MSIQKQTFSSWEHIIVDDGSSDDSAAVVAKYQATDQRLRLYVQPNGGVSNARNNGFRLASPDSEYLLFLDADDVLRPGMLERMVRYLDEHPHVGLVHCEPELIGENSETLQEEWRITRYVPASFWGARELAPGERETPFLSVYAMAVIIPSLSVIRRNVYLRTKGWDETLGQPCEDTDLFLQIALSSTLHFLPEKLIRHRRHASQSTGDQAHLERQKERLYRKWRHRKDLPQVQHRQVREADYFLQNGLGFHMGLLAGVRSLREGQLVTAARFVGGAIRRRLQKEAVTEPALQ